MLKSKTRRILLSAYGCEPGKGSEQGVGWNWALQLANSANLTIITRSNNRAAIEAALPEALRDCVCFEFYDLAPMIAQFKRKEKGLYFYYLLWQWGAYRRACQLALHGRFDYVIALTFGSIWMPTFMYLLPVPFIWGPVGGGEAVPFELIRSLPLRARFAQYFRYVLMSTVRINPFVIRPIRNARFVLVRTEDTARLIPLAYSNKVRVVLETAVSDDLLVRPALPRDLAHSGPLRVIYTGRLVALKNVPAALHAVARAKGAGANIELVLVGDGPERQNLELLASLLGIKDNVQFRGAISHEQVIVELQRSDVYLFPSLKEGGVWSLMEAMSVSLPVICVNTSGMAIITDDSSAIRVEPVSQEHLIASFTEALLALACAPEHRLQLGQNARARIEKHFRWNHKGVLMREIFEELEYRSA